MSKQGGLRTFFLAGILALGLLPAYVPAYGQIQFDDFEISQKDDCNFHIVRPEQFSPSATPISLVDELFSLGTFNILNVSEHAGRYMNDKQGHRVFVEGSTPKDPAKIAKAYSLIRKAGAMIMGVQEVESADHFAKEAKHRLRDQYEPFVFDGNDPKGNKIGIYIRRDLPFNITFESHSHHYWYRDVAKGSSSRIKVHLRDVVAMIVRRHGDPPDAKPIAVIIVSHDKSQRDSEGDPKSKRWREAQNRNKLWIKKKYEERFGKKMAIIFMGDHNMNLQSEEASLLYNEGNLRNSLISAPTRPLLSNTVTHFFFLPNGNPHHTQMDGQLVNPAAQRLLREAAVIYDGQFPQSFEEREPLGSDHVPVVSKYDFSKYFRVYNREENQ